MTDTAEQLRKRSSLVLGLLLIAYLILLAGGTTMLSWPDALCEALAMVQIRSQVTGQLSAIHFAEGQEVRKGQTLFSLDQRPFQTALEQAQAVLAKDTAQAKNAQSQATRYSDLFARGLIPRVLSSESSWALP